MPLPFTRQELTALVVLGATGLIGITGPLITRAAPPPAVAPAVVNLNTASAAELEALPGIGPVTAQRIVESRQRDGRFLRADDLRRVKGLSAVAIARLKPHVRME